MKLMVSIKKAFPSFMLDVDFEADIGVTGLLGASGCGKSMTLKCIAGIVKPDSGHIELAGVTLFDSQRKINLPPQKRKVGYLFQHYALFPGLTVRQNILTGLQNEKNRAVKNKELTEVLKLMQLEGFEQARPFQLSGGQQQRVALARILVNKPKLLMLDEPFSALDSHLRDKLQMEMKGVLEQYGRPSLMVTHNRDEAYLLCKNIALMEEGQVLVKKPTELLFADPGSIPAAILTGCKNISAAVKLDSHTLYATDWGIKLKSAVVLEENLVAIGIRAHHFDKKEKWNRLPISISTIIEEPFEVTILFRYQGQSSDSRDVLWRIPKENRSQVTMQELGVDPIHVLPLYGNGRKKNQ